MVVRRNKHGDFVSARECERWVQWSAAGGGHMEGGGGAARTSSAAAMLSSTGSVASVARAPSKSTVAFAAGGRSGTAALPSDAWYLAMDHADIREGDQVKW